MWCWGIMKNITDVLNGSCWLVSNQTNVCDGGGFIPAYQESLGAQRVSRKEHFDTVEEEGAGRNLLRTLQQERDDWFPFAAMRFSFATSPDSNSDYDSDPPCALLMVIIYCYGWSHKTEWQCWGSKYTLIQDHACVSSWWVGIYAGVNGQPHQISSQMQTRYLLHQYHSSRCFDDESVSDVLGWERPHMAECEIWLAVTADGISSAGFLSLQLCCFGSLSFCQQHASYFQRKLFQKQKVHHLHRNI